MGGPTLRCGSGAPGPAPLRPDAPAGTTDVPRRLDAAGTSGLHSSRGEGLARDRPALATGRHAAAGDPRGASAPLKLEVTRIVIAEDHDVVRRGVRDLLARHAGWEIAGEARTGRQALDMVRRARPDVVIVDLSIPELAGVEVIRQVRTERPETALCVFTMHEDAIFVGDALAAGARAYVLKSEPASHLVGAVEALARREPYFSPWVTDLVVQALVQAHAEPGSGFEDPLTEREHEVAQLLVGGLGSRAISARLGITTKTVDTHRAAIKQKLGLRSMADLVRYAIRHRLIEP
jgi:DNA-binding NarL/FixJ family response regulator